MTSVATQCHRRERDLKKGIASSLSMQWLIGLLLGFFVPRSSHCDNAMLSHSLVGLPCASSFAYRATISLDLVAMIASRRMMPLAMRALPQTRGFAAPFHCKRTPLTPVLCRWPVQQRYIRVGKPKVETMTQERVDEQQQQQQQAALQHQQDADVQEQQRSMSSPKEERRHVDVDH